jgi:hypothetical protein
MSSATSTEQRTERPGFRAGHFFVVAALAAATVAVLLATRTAPAQLVMLSLTVFAAGATAVAAYRVLAPLAGPEHGGTRPLGRHTRASLEADKTTVLRTIKELEFDRAMGKMSDDDFKDMSQRLRQRAVRLMQQLDDTRATQRARIERELEERLGARGAPPAAVSSEPELDRLACGSCHALNDADARFCKACGQRLAS